MGTEQPPSSTQPTTGHEIPKAKSEKNDATNRRKKINRLRKAGNFWISLITLIALVAYTAISRNQWQQMVKATIEAKESADTARDTLVSSSRPWIGVVGRPAITELSVRINEKKRTEVTNAIHYTRYCFEVPAPIEKFRSGLIPHCGITTGAD